jgi:hypothetical protein
MHGEGVGVRVPVLFSLAPLLGSLLPYWSTGLITQFLDLSQAVGLLGRVISSSQGLYLNTGQHTHRKTRTHIKYPCPRRYSNPQSRSLSDRRLFMPQTARLPRPARVPVGAGFSYFHVQTRTGEHPASYPMGTGGSFLGGKAAEA